MTRLLVSTTIALVAALSSSANATTVINYDEVPYTLLVTEAGQQIEVVIRAGDSIEICPSGCFVVMPNGDREALTGTERLEIQSGRTSIF